MDYLSEIKQLLDEKLGEETYRFNERAMPDGSVSLMLEMKAMDEQVCINLALEQYLRAAAASGCLFEVNTGAISRGYRTAPYPCENLLHILKKNGNGLVLASDSHNADTLDYGFEEARRYLKELGFSHVYVLGSGGFEKDVL